MRIEAKIANANQSHAVLLSTDGASKSLAIPPRPSGGGSSVNGGELLCLALATCYCNDIYREAAKRNIAVLRVEVHAQAEFGGPGESATTLRYRASVEARAPESDVRELMLHTDRVAEIQGTLRKGMDVRFEQIEATSVA